MEWLKIIITCVIAFFVLKVAKGILKLLLTLALVGVIAYYIYPMIF